MKPLGLVLLLSTLCHAQERITAADLASALQQRGRVALRELHFDTGKDTLKRESAEQLAEIVTLLKADPELRISIEVHTDSRGSTRANQVMSTARALRVKKHLLEQGIDDSRLESEGYGEARPIAPNDTAEGRAQNRRVELVRR